VWHASIAFVLEGTMIPADRLPRKERRLGFELGRKLLQGVGVEPSKEETKSLAFHVRRALAPIEMRRIDPAWLALEPIDSG
jgi:hypothetical protein